MFKQLSIGEMVRVVSGESGKLPTEFTWRGRRHLVRRIEGYRTEYRYRQGGISERKHFHLRTSRGMSVMLSQDVDRGSWHLESVIMGGGGGS
jgi:hypothetical protein